MQRNRETSWKSERWISYNRERGGKKRVGVEATLRGTDNTLHYWEWRDTLDEMRDELVMIERERRREKEKRGSP